MLAVVGYTTRDLVDARAPRPGGAPLFAARALAALGEPALIVTRCSADDAELVVPLRAIGLPLIWRPEAVTPTFRLGYTEGGAREVVIEALADPWPAEDVAGWLGQALRGVEWVHLGALWRGEFPADTLAQLSRGRRLSFDGQGLVRPGAVGPVHYDADFDPRLLDEIDVLHLSGDEAEVLGLAADVSSLGSLGVPEIVITLGEEGSIVFARGRLQSVPARPVAGADPTGAGDAFMAAYLASRRQAHGPVSAARRATEVVRGLLTGTLR
jgi:sugar/nucleoside kinase (ribokinase family)